MVSSKRKCLPSDNGGIGILFCFPCIDFQLVGLTIEEIGDALYTWQLVCFLKMVLLGTLEFVLDDPKILPTRTFPGWIEISINYNVSEMHLSVILGKYFPKMLI